MKLNTIFILLFLGLCIAQPIMAAEAKTEARFQLLSGPIVLDSRTGLMWATRDNGKDATFYDAEKHCDLLRTGGYDDWRLPDIKELMTLYLPGKRNSSGCFMSDLFKLSECSFWSSYSSIGGAALFNFRVGKRSFGYNRDSYQLRALAVRGTMKPKSDDKS